MPTFQCPVGDKSLIVETGRFAGQAGGAVTVRYGDTVSLVTACVSRNLREGIDFLPLTIDFEERLYAAGKIPGGFFRREGRPSQDATLAARLTDRPVRPLFPKGFRNEVQVVITILSADQENDPDILGIVGASASLCISETPFHGPVGAVRVAYIDGDWVLNPTFSQLREAQLEVTVASTREAVVMVEAAAKQAPEALVAEALRRGFEANLDIVRLQEDMISVLGKPKLEFQALGTYPGVADAVASALEGPLPDLLAGDKAMRENGLDGLRREVIGKLAEKFPKEEISAAFETRVKSEVKKRVLSSGARLDGRAYDQLRPIRCEVGLLPRPHGSGLFTRGATQVLTLTTLGSVGMEQKIDTLSPEESKRFLHHYNFPPFSVGEVRRMTGPGRREVGHGALAEKAVAPILPGEDEFPYMIRLVSEVLSSNGSTSMGSVCGSSLSLMDAGVPVKSHVAGVAMGLVTGEDGNKAILTDIEGAEDQYGDMDFKVAGTAQGVTALQMDTKLTGVSLEVLEEAIQQAQQARLTIMESMREAIAEPRTNLSGFAPKIYRMKINPEKIGAVIGSGGKTIRGMSEEFGVSIDVENDGTVFIGTTNEDQANKAMARIEALTKDVEVGQIYTGKVSRLMAIGAMVEILPGKEGLVPLGELAEYQVRRAGDVVQEGDEVMVKVMEIDRRGRVNLSRRAVYETEPRPSRPGGGDRRYQDRRGPPRPPYPRRD
ncbi:MAG: polyribonucleotide nucleotidyltransferase [Dehalococcoidia bacterium]|nr:polyribonucleotide nucleotidyltransferase [Dehalococcoidia bacterium]